MSYSIADSITGRHWGRMRPAQALFMICVALVVLFRTKAVAQTTELRVRILRSKNHRPIKGRWVQVQFFGPRGESYANAPQQVGRTRSDGIVIFRVAEPVPAFIDVVDLNGYPCSDLEVFPTADLMRRGVVSPAWTPRGKQSLGLRKADEWCTPDPSAPQPRAAPGEVVFYVHPLNFWQRFQRDRQE
jgi:hypothetical protein